MANDFGDLDAELEAFEQTNTPAAAAPADLDTELESFEQGFTAPQAAPLDPLDAELQSFEQQSQAEYQQLVASGDDPSQDNGAGFFPSLASGAAGVWNSVFNETGSLLAPALRDISDNPDWQAFWQSEVERVEGNRQELTRFRAEQPVSRTLENLGQTESVEAFFDTFMESDEKWTVVKELLGNTIPFSAGMIGGGAVAGVPGAFSAVFMMDWGDNYREGINQGMKKDDAMERATIMAGVQAGFDAATFKAADVHLVKNKIADMLSQTTFQGLMGAGAEFSKHAAVGEDVTTGQMGLEFVGEFLGAPLEVLSRRGMTSKEKAVQEIMERLDKIQEDDTVETLQVLAADMEQQLSQALDVSAQQTVPGGEVSNPTFEAYIPEQTSERIENEVVVETPNGDVTATQLVDWEQTPVVMTADTYFKPAIEAIQEQITKNEVEASLLEDLIAAQPDPKLVQELADIKEFIVADKSAVEVLQKQEAEESQFRRQMFATIDNWTKTFMPGAKVILDLHQGTHLMARAQHNRHNLGQTKSLDSNSSGGYNQTQNGIHVLTTNVAKGYAVDPNVFRTEAVLETTAHEFSHALMYETYRNQSPEVKQAILKGWQKWLKKMESKERAHQFIKQRKAPFTAQRVSNMAAESLEKAAKSIDSKGEPEGKEIWQSAWTNRKYTMGMDEYLADSFARIVGTNETVKGQAAPYFRKTLDIMRRFFRRFKDDYGTEQEFSQFISFLAAKNTNAELKQIIESGKSEAQQLDRLKNTIGALVKETNALPPARFNTTKELPYHPDNLKGDIDRYNKGAKWGASLLQLTNDNSHIQGLKKYTQLVKNLWNDKMQWTAQADDTMKMWKKLGHKRADKIGRFMLDLTIASYEQEKRLNPTDPVFNELLEKHGIADDKKFDEILAVIDRVDEDFALVLNELEQAQIDHANRVLTDPNEIAAEVREISKTFNDLRDRNFFPLSRFGEYYVRTVAEADGLYDGVEYKAGDTIAFETFESEKQQQKRVNVLRKDKRLIVKHAVLNDTQRQFMGLPPTLVSTIRNRLELTPDQQHEFEQIMKDMKPGKSFEKHLKQRKNVAGYSKDAIRGYANYFMHFGNYVAKLKYKDQMREAINEVGSTVQILDAQPQGANKRAGIRDFMSDHYDYMMEPGNEFANLRALGFIWYLGFVPKSAVVNLTQVPLVTYPYLAARHGDATALKYLLAATKKTKDYWLNPQRLKPREHDMMRQLRDILEESMATELAATAEGSMLQRVAPGTFLKNETAARWIRNGAGAGAWMFQKAENQNRKLTALAGYNLAYDQAVREGVDIAEAHQKAVEAARNAVESTQFEYAKWNRPRLMRGKKSVFFLFWMYLQNSLYFVARDPGNMRYLGVLFLAAGLSGLPFAEDAMDILEYMKKKYNKKTGQETFSVNIRNDLRQGIRELGLNPDLVMHGSSRYMFGMPALMDAIGIPMPNADMSGSISMGRIIPGIEPIFGREGSFDETSSRFATEAGGAVINMPIQLFRAISDDDPRMLKRFEKAMPSFARNMSKAYRHATEGVETLPNGAVITEFDLEDHATKAEVALQAMGFPSTRVAETREKYYMTREVGQYYVLRRQSLMEHLDYAYSLQDAEMVEKVRDEITSYNRTVPFSGMIITGKDLRRSLTTRIKDRAKIEGGLFVPKRQIQIQRDVEQGFVEEEVVK